MATLNGNDVYVTLGGTDVSGYWTGEVSRNVTNNIVEVTAGAGTDWVERLDGINDYSLSLDIVYDITDVSTYLARLKPGTVQTLVYGPEGNTAGKPKDEVSVIVASVDGPNPTINKDMVMFSLSLQGAATPTAWIENGDTF